MKRYEFELGMNIIKKFFPHYRIKDKLDVTRILLEAIRFMLVWPNVPKGNTVGRLILYIDKMSRLFFISKNKYYSIVFPFLVKKVEEKFFFSLKNIVEIDSELISKAMSILNSEHFEKISSIDFIEPIFEYEERINKKFWFFLKELLIFEDGYIRYDHDVENYKRAKEKGKEDIHPLNHYDLFYTSNATFKIGLNNAIREEDFIRLLDINQKCEYLTNRST